MPGDPHHVEYPRMSGFTSDNEGVARKWATLTIIARGEMRFAISGVAWRWQMPIRRPWMTLRLWKMSLLAVVLLFQAENAGLVLGIPTTLEGPFTPVTVPFDTVLRKGSQDLPVDDPRVVKKVPSIFPEQIALALSTTPDAMWVSWITGDAQIGAKVTPLDPSTVASEVYYGTDSNQLSFTAQGHSEVYSQVYPFKGLLQYTSGIIHHVRLTGLLPNTKYYYSCGDSRLRAMSKVLSFTTMSNPGRFEYPARIAVVGDLGLTHNSTSTMDHLQMNVPSLLLLLGDLTYSDQYETLGNVGVSCFSCSFPNAPTRETYQPHWDAWGRFMEPITSAIPMMVIEGNHEEEPQSDGLTFASYLARFAVPSQESKSNTSMYYSFNAGGIHFIMLGAYADYDQTSAQYAWLQQDLRDFSRSETPWLIAAWHPPWYNSYSSHYREAECMRLEMEDLLYRHRVDIVLSGHVHAYERSNRVYDYTLDQCGPVYITIGDGGNIEQVEIQHADDPGGCPKPKNTVPNHGKVCAKSFTSGPAKGQFCWSSQPEWSAFRESSFGHGILEVLNSTHALWTWHRNQDVYGESSFGDQIYIVRGDSVCSGTPVYRRRKAEKGDLL